LSGAAIPTIATGASLQRLYDAELNVVITFRPDGTYDLGYGDDRNGFEASRIEVMGRGTALVSHDSGQTVPRRCRAV
jgi:hypothetical protein